MASGILHSLMCYFGLKPYRKNLTRIRCVPRNALKTGHKAKKTQPQSRIRIRVVVWRRRWDSNPRTVARHLISSQGRYDHFDTPPRPFHYNGKREKCQVRRGRDGLSRAGFNISRGFPQSPQRVFRPSVSSGVRARHSPGGRVSSSVTQPIRRRSSAIRGWPTAANIRLTW